MTGAVRVVVLTYGRGGEHVPLLQSLLDEGLAPADVLIVHNAAAPDEPDPDVPEGFEILRTGGNLGYAGGMNRGIERELAGEAELLLLLTHDARLRPGALARMLEAAAQRTDVGVFGPALMVTGTDEVFSYGGSTDDVGANRHIVELPAAAGAVAECEWVDGGTMLIRAEALRRAGGFDERFWGYYEETDLCLRIRTAGYRVAVVTAAFADQDPGGGKRPGAWAYLMARNGIEYARRAAGRRGLFAAVRRLSWLVVLYSARALVRAIGIRPGDHREMVALAIGTVRGEIDFARGRWGPPPAGLPGIGDVGNA